MKKLFIMTLMFIITLCENCFIGENEIINNSNEQIQKQTNEIIADVVENKQEKEVVVKITEDEENLKEKKIIQKETEQKKSNQQDDVKTNSITNTNTNSNTKKQENQSKTHTSNDSNTKTTTSTETEQKEENYISDNKENSNKIEEKHIHFITVNGGWFNSESEAEAEVDREFGKWDKEYKNGNITWEKLVEKCPIGYEIFRCSCGSYGLNFSYN